MQNLKAISTILFTILLWHISLWNNDIPFPFKLIDLPGKFYHEWLLPYKTEIGITAGLLVLIIQLLGLKNPFRYRKKKILNSIQDHFIKTKFNGNVDNNRITIFKIKKGYQIYHLFLRNCIYREWKENKDKKILKFYFHNKFPQPFRSYLIQYSRNGHPYPKGSSTFFLVPENHKEVSSVTADAIFRESPQKVKLPEIDMNLVHSIDDIETYRGKKKGNIISYMKQGKVNSFEMLKTFHRFPNKIYADPIILDNQEKWGCIVFDSDDKEIDFENSYQDFVDFSRIVQSVIINLKN